MLVRPSRPHLSSAIQAGKKQRQDTKRSTSKQHLHCICCLTRTVACNTGSLLFRHSPFLRYNLHAMKGKIIFDKILHRENGAFPSITDTIAKTTTAEESPRLRRPPLHRKPFKKRFKKLRVEGKQKESAVPPATQLQRQVASHWTHPQDPLRECGEKLSWQEMTKETPSSGPFNHQEYYETQRKKRTIETLKDHRPSLIDDEEDDGHNKDKEALEAAKAVEAPDETTKPAPAKIFGMGTFVRSESPILPYNSFLLFDEEELEQELHLLTLQCYENKGMTNESSSNTNTSRCGTPAVTPSPNPDQDQSPPRLASHNEQSTKLPSMIKPGKSYPQGASNSKSSLASGAGSFKYQHPGATIAAACGEGNVASSKAPTEIKLPGFPDTSKAHDQSREDEIPFSLHHTGTSFTVDDVMRSTFIPTPNPSPNTSTDESPAKLSASDPFAEDSTIAEHSEQQAPKKHYHDLPNKTFYPSGKQESSSSLPIYLSRAINTPAQPARRETLWKGPKCRPGSKEANAPEDHPLFSPLQSGRASSAFAPGHPMPLRIPYAEIHSPDNETTTI